MSADQLVEREALEAFDRSISKFQQTMEDAAKSGALDTERLERLGYTMKEVAARANSQLLPRIDPELAAEISGRMISILTLNTTRHEVLDAADIYLTDLEAIRHVLRDLLQEQHPRALRQQANELIALMQAWLPSIAVHDLAELCGLSVRQLQRRRHERGPASSREQLVARLVAILRHAWTDAGVVAWFRRPRLEWDGRAPIELLADPNSEADLLSAARAGRVQGGI